MVRTRKKNKTEFDYLYNYTVDISTGKSPAGHPVYLLFIIYAVASVPRGIYIFVYYYTSRVVFCAEFIQPICLPILSNIKNAVLEGAMPFVAGWGSTQSTSTLSKYNYYLIHFNLIIQSISYYFFSSYLNLGVIITIFIL